MTRKPESKHITGALPDYVLGLLPGDEAEWVAAHVSVCSQCQGALAAEQEIGRAVQRTLGAATRPDPVRLRRLMPAPPASSRPAARWLAFSPAAAAAALMIVLLFGAVALFSNQRPGAWTLTAPTARSTAMVLTDTPTSTATRELTATADELETYLAPGMASPSPAAAQVSAPAPALIPVPGAAYLTN